MISIRSIIHQYCSSFHVGQVGRYIITWIHLKVAVSFLTRKRKASIHGRIRFSDSVL